MSPVVQQQRQGPASTGPRRLVLFFRNDLRLHDNYIVHEAVQKIKAKEYDDVVPVYCFDSRFFKASPWGYVKTGAHRAQFLLESVQDLKASLRAIGSDLLVAVGLPEDVIAGVASGSSSCTVLTQQEVTSEEAAVDGKVIRALQPLGGSLVKVWGSTLYHLDDVSRAMGPLGVKGMPDVYTPFKDKVEKAATVRKEVAAPKPGELPLPRTQAQPAAAAPTAETASVGASGAPGAAAFDLASRLAAFPEWGTLPWPKGAAPAPPAAHPNGVLPFKGGETVALARLKYYVWDSDLVSTYFDTRNGMLGGDYSTKLAPWLSAGCISPRTVHHQIKQYESQRVSNKSTYWVTWELTCRDYFRFSAMKHGSRIFFEGGLVGKRQLWNGDPEVWRRWRDGRTGMPLVDANMRELAATGWMSNRGRQNVASYLVLDLGVDWRRGADYFEHALLDYDVASNWGNWVAMAGLTGGRINHFNITKQSKDYDPEGEYLRTWLPELRNVPTSRIHEPWLMSREEMDRYGVQIGVDYPEPIPTSQHGRPHGGGGGRGGGGERGGGYRGGEGRGRGSGAGGRPGSGRPESGRPASGRGAKRLSEFERYG